MLDPALGLLERYEELNAPPRGVRQVFDLPTVAERPVSLSPNDKVPGDSEVAGHRSGPLSC